MPVRRPKPEASPEKCLVNPFTYTNSAPARSSSKHPIRRKASSSSCLTRLTKTNLKKRNNHEKNIWFVNSDNDFFSSGICRHSSAGRAETQTDGDAETSRRKNGE